MSIVSTTATIDGVAYDYTYSDAGRFIVRDGLMYEEAYDPLGSGRTYTEGDIIPDDGSTPEEILSILLGGTDD